jgi:hypothetical protein
LETIRTFNKIIGLMIRRYLCFFLLFVCHCLVPARLLAQNQILVEGVVFERGSSSRIASAQIINRQTGYGVTTSTLGLFQIRASIGDTLLVVKPGYSDAEVVIKDEKDVLIHLAGSTALREVVIRGQSKKQELDAIKKDFKNKGSFYQGKPPVLSFIFTPLTALYELFGRTPKNARRFGQYYTNELQQTHIDGLFNEALVTKTVGLDGDSLENFMINYRPHYEKAKNWAQYDAIKYIRDSYKKYTDTLSKK